MSQVDTPQISLPFEILPDGSVKEVEQDTLDEIAMSVETILRYPLGSRPELPNFGIPELAFHEDIDEVRGIILNHVRRWEDRADVFVDARPDDWDAMIQRFVLSISGSD